MSLSSIVTKVLSLAETGATDEAWTAARDLLSAQSDDRRTRWKALGQHIEMGRFGLPEGDYPATKVRLAQFPAAERDRGQDDPGIEETIWIQRLSPCHGIVRSAPFEDHLGVESGDVVLIDGAPITHHENGARSVPVFPHLATLERGDYHVFRFVALQRQAGGVAALSARLPNDSVLYVHTEQVQILCETCQNDPTSDHASHAAKEHHLVHGMMCVPPSIAPIEIRRVLDAVVAGADGIDVYVPELSDEIGDEARADRERRRIDEITPPEGG